MLRILITNDDSLESNGLRHLEEELRTCADVWAVAPDRQRSATSQAVTIHGTLRLIKVSERHFMVNGYPADCVSVAMFSGKFPPFDMVISGINHGYNLGDDIHYSGTVGAARHAAIHGLKAVAVSSAYTDLRADMRRVSRFVREWVLENESRLKTGTVYNINYPDETGLEADAPLPKYRYTFQGRRTYTDNYEETETGENYSVLKLNECVMGHYGETGSDFMAVSEGYISITPLSLDMTDRAVLEKIRGG